MVTENHLGVIRSTISDKSQKLQAQLDTLKNQIEEELHKQTSLNELEVKK